MNLCTHHLHHAILIFLDAAPCHVSKCLSLFSVVTKLLTLFLFKTALIIVIGQPKGRAGIDFIAYKVTYITLMKTSVLEAQTEAYKKPLVGLTL